VTLVDALKLLETLGTRGRPIAGGTDLILELARGARPGVEELVDLTRIPGLDKVVDRGDAIELGPLVTHNQAVRSALLVEHALPLTQACLEVGSSPLRNRATVAGNVVTASPANDTISALLALDATVELRSTARSRRVPIGELIVGYRTTAMRPGELLTSIRIPKPTARDRGVFVKVGNRSAQAISVVHAAAVLSFDDDRVVAARIALGSVGPRVERVPDVERVLLGRALTDQLIDGAAKTATGSVDPIDDVRATAEYRRRVTEVIVRRALTVLRDGSERSRWPRRLVSLDDGTGVEPLFAGTSHAAGDQVEALVNGEVRRAANAAGRTLLDWLRWDAHAAGPTPLTGTKEGCAEGECGACTIHLDGASVLACLVPAARAHGARIATIEGLASNGELHPLQAAYVECGAVQCGYCIPGFLMAGAKLLEEYPQPTADDVRQALAGNLCRCTGYYTMFEAFEAAGRRG
jgi:carbon-monoxide dehydrogenase medium subunit